MRNADAATGAVTGNPQPALYWYARDSGNMKHRNIRHKDKGQGRIPLDLGPRTMDNSVVRGSPASTVHFMTLWRLRALHSLHCTPAENVHSRRGPWTVDC